MLSGTRGSGTVFFSGCNLQCVFCQNHDISRRQKGSILSYEALAHLFLDLQAQGAHNINLVTPTPHIPALLKSIPLAKAQGLTIPILYNSSGYEALDALRSLEGLVDIYLPDFKYASPARSMAYANADDYFLHAGPAILEMHRQVGVLQLDAQGIATRGLLIRHLVLPGNLDETRRILAYLQAHVPQETYLSLMRQYTPPAHMPPPLNRKLIAREYQQAVRIGLCMGWPHVYVQQHDSASSAYTPAFYDELQ